MSGMIEAGAGAVLVGIFAVLSCGPTVRRLVRRRVPARPKTRPTIPNLAALHRTHEW